MQITSFTTNLNASSIFHSKLNSYPDESFFWYKQNPSK